MVARIRAYRAADAGPTSKEVALRSLEIAQRALEVASDANRKLLVMKDQVDMLRNDLVHRMSPPIMPERRKW
jgi:hypothetical protein